MCIEIKVKVPSIKNLQYDGWARNAVFRIVEGGGEIEPESLVSIWRALEGNAKYDFAQRMFPTTQLEYSQLSEVLNHHKRSKVLRLQAFTKQHCLSSEEANKYFADWVSSLIKALEKEHGKETTWYTKMRKIVPFSTSYRLDPNLGIVPSWYISASNRGTNPRSFDDLDEETLMKLSWAIAEWCNKVRTAGRYSTGHNSVRNYLAAIASGTRVEPVVPLISCKDDKVSNQALAAYAYIASKEENNG
jgi:hypothetical protein